MASTTSAGSVKRQHPSPFLKKGVERWTKPGNMFEEEDSEFHIMEPVKNSSAQIPPSARASGVVFRTMRHIPVDPSRHIKFVPHLRSYSHKAFQQWSQQVSKGNNHAVVLLNSTIPSLLSPAEARDEVIGHSSLAHYMYVCWAKEIGCVLRPDMLWFTICAELAREIRLQPELYKSLFTVSTSDAKERVVILTKEVESLPIDELDKMLEEKIVCKELHDLIVKRTFDDDDDQEKKPGSPTALFSETMKIAFANSSTPYFEIMSSFCGIPFTRIEKSEKQWQRLADSISDLERIIAPLNGIFGEWLSEKRALVDEIIFQAFYNSETSSQDKDLHQYSAESFFSAAFWIASNCGSGHPYYCRGWILDFIYRSSDGEHYFNSQRRCKTNPPQKRDECNWPVNVIEDLPSHSVFVPWRNIETKRAFAKTAGLFYSTVESHASENGRSKFLIPHYATTSYEVKDETFFSELAMCK